MANRSADRLPFSQFSRAVQRCAPRYATEDGRYSGNRSFDSANLSAIADRFAL